MATFSIDYETMDGEIDNAQVEALREEGAMILFCYRHIYRRILSVAEESDTISEADSRTAQGVSIS